MLEQEAPKHFTSAFILFTKSFIQVLLQSITNGAASALSCLASGTTIPATKFSSYASSASLPLMLGRVSTKNSAEKSTSSTILPLYYEGKVRMTAEHIMHRPKKN